MLRDHEKAVSLTLKLCPNSPLQPKPKNMHKERIGLILGILLFVLVGFVIPTQMPAIAQYTLAITLLMAVWWVTEALPLAVTALLPLVFFPMMGVLPLKKAGAGYSDPIIFLFLGGFMLAIAIERWDLHKRIALSIILRTGASLDKLIFGFIMATGCLSMWISNTATALMMLPIGLAIIRQLAQMQDSGISEPEQARFAKALLLGIAYASSIGGIATLIGTPTNMVFTSFVSKNYPNSPVSFADWMLFAMPATVIMLFVCWWYLVRFGFPVKSKLNPDTQAVLETEKSKLGSMSYEEKWVAAIFFTVAMAWIFRGFLVDWAKSAHGLDWSGLNDTSIALIGAVTLFIIPSKQAPKEALLTWEVASKLPWDVILLFGGGLSLAEGFDSSGLATWIAQQLSVLQAIPFLGLLFAVSLLVLVLTEFASNVATVSMMLPVLASLALSLDVHPYILMISATCVASAGFMMPMGTAANALVFGTGYLQLTDMIKAGFWLDLISIILFTLYAYWVVPLLFLGG